MENLNLVYDWTEIGNSFQSVYLESLSNLNFEDKAYFDHSQYLDTKVTEKNVPSKYFQKEAEYISKMNKVLEDGNALMYTLYAFRSCGKAIPQVQSQDQSNKEMLYYQQCEVLRQEIYGMVNLMNFRDKLTACFTEVMTGIIPDIKDRELFPSEGFLLTLSKILDLTFCLDTMKNFKGSMSNDLSMYKRAKQMITKNAGDPELQILPKLGFFLASKDQMSMDLKNTLSSMSDTYEDVLIDMINLCTEYIENDHYLCPNSKHIYFRAISFAIYLIDGEGEEKDYVKKKKFKVERVGKLLKSCPIVPIFGDIAINLGSILLKSPHWSSKYDLNRIEDDYKTDLKKSYLLVNSIDSAITRYRSCFLDLISLDSILTSKNLDEEQAKICYKYCFNGLKLLSRFTNQILEQAAFKYLNPASSQSGQELTSIYEQAVQFNYDPNEKKVLIKYIGMVKSLASLLNKYTPKIQKILDQHMYNQIQNFTKVNVTDYYNSALKKKKNTANLLKNVRDGLLDTENESRVVLERADPISFSQLFFARSMLDLMFNEKSKGMKGGMMKEKNFKDSQVTELEQFFNESHFYPQLIKLSSTIKECSDLSNLWFKEFYLELTKQVQFRTNTSLPWILAEYALDSNQTDILLDLFMPLDLYNDAAYKTLYHLKSKFIYNEIEAEVNLCFDQFMFKLGKSMFRHYKKLASIKNLDSESKTNIQQTKSLWTNDNINPEGYVKILKQRNFRLLGRSIDINLILAQMVNQYLRHSIDAAITRFESCDITGVIELDYLLKIARTTHELLSEHLQLEKFENLMEEVDECLQPGEINGRICTHIVEELVRDVVPNYCFNNVTSRFIRSSVFYAEPVQRPNIPNTKLMYLYGTKPMSIEYSLKCGQYKDYVGEVHFEVISRLLGVPGLAVISSELSNHVTLIMDHTMKRFFEGILDITPSKIEFPIDQENLTNLYNYLLSKHGMLTNHKSLKSDMLQAFREIGNAISLAKLFEETFSLQIQRDKLLIQDIVSYEPETTCYINKIGEFDQFIEDQSPPLTFNDWTMIFKKIVRGMTARLGSLKNMLRCISRSLKKIPDFREPQDILSGVSFAKVWSSLSFVACIPAVAGERTIRELFGDGLPIAGATLMYIFGQTSIFTVLDINRHLVNMSKSENEKKMNNNNEINRYLNNASWFERVSDETHTILRNA